MSKKAIAKASAKINLTLEVLKKRPDNYHNIKSIATTIPLHNILKIGVTPTKNQSKITISSKSKLIPKDKTNNCYKAAAALLQKTNQKFDIKISIQKNIPLEAGLGGSSTDAATTLTTLNKLLNLNLPIKELLKISSKIGSDLGIFILGGITLLEEIGNKIKNLRSKPLNLPILILELKEKTSTQKAYQSLKIPIKQSKRIILTDKLKNFILKNKDLENKITDMSHFFINDFESSSESVRLNLLEIKNMLKSLGAVAVGLCGSGSSVYAIFTQNKQLLNAEKTLSDIDLPTIKKIIALKK